MISRSTLLWLVLPFLVFSAIPGEGRAQELPDTSSTLFQSHWTGSVLGRTESGALCWVAGPEGALRLEILFGAESSGIQGSPSHLLEALLQQRGQGYCLVLGEGADGTFNPWGEPWQRLDSAVAHWLVAVARLVADGPDAPSTSLLPWREVTPATRGPEFRRAPGRVSLASPASRTWHAELPALKRVTGEPALASDTTTFRSASVQRGLGRGGSAEILRLAFSPGSPGTWTLTTSRKPGRLELSDPHRHAIRVPGLEAFAPLWPLAELLIFDVK
jgi:hypothetical protein